MRAFFIYKASTIHTELRGPYAFENQEVGTKYMSHPQLLYWQWMTELKMYLYQAFKQLLLRL